VVLEHHHLPIYKRDLYVSSCEVRDRRLIRKSIVIALHLQENFASKEAEWSEMWRLHDPIARNDIPFLFFAAEARFAHDAMDHRRLILRRARVRGVNGSLVA
jgi:hypothetical protein